MQNIAESSERFLVLRKVSVILVVVSVCSGCARFQHPLLEKIVIIMMRHGVLVHIF